MATPSSFAISGSSPSDVFGVYEKTLPAVWGGVCQRRYPSIPSEGLKQTSPGLEENLLKLQPQP